MKAAVLNERGSGLRLEEVPVPEPRAGEVLVRTAACGVCHTDLHVMKGEVAFPTPCVLGHEISGTVANVGSGVDGLQEGDRVVGCFVMPCGRCFFCRRGEDDLCETFFEYNRLRGTLYDGDTRLARPDGSPLWMYSMAGLAEYCVVPATAVFALPDDTALSESSILGCALFTAFGALRNGADLRAGETVAVVAVGGVGSAAVQLARVFGAASVIAVDLDDDKLANAKRLGASATINARTDDVPERIRELTGGRGVDLAIEAFGSPVTLASALESVRDGGKVVVVGIAPQGVTAPIELARLVRRKIEIRGSYGARAHADMPRLLALVASGALHPAETVTRRYTLAEANAAYTDLDEGRILGRAIVEIAADSDEPVIRGERAA